MTAREPFPNQAENPDISRLEIASVTYTNVTITDTTNNVSEPLGTFTSGCLLPEVRGAC